jgi:hypothetical protein
MPEAFFIATLAGLLISLHARVLAILVAAVTVSAALATWGMLVGVPPLRLFSVLAVVLVSLQFGYWIGLASQAALAKIRSVDVTEFDSGRERKPDS